MPYDTPTETVTPFSIYEVRGREDHMDLAFIALRMAADFADRPASAREYIENARAHLVAFNNWSDAARPVEVA